MRSLREFVDVTVGHLTEMDNYTAKHFGSDIPIYTQIRNEIVAGIASGKLKEGDRLPSIRALAEESGVNMLTVSKAYTQLKQEGYILTDRRNGTVVANPNTTVSEKTIQALRMPVLELKASGKTIEEVQALCTKLYREEI